jgi:tetratricopeptide (TPR) repeat protein
VLSGLLLAVALVFGRTVRHDFVNFDDNLYVYDNPHVTAGLTPPGIAWAFTHTAAANWHPLTWISHMADCQAYGLWAGGHHLTSVLLHALVAVLLLLLLWQLTDDFWPSVLATALFAVHPLRVESVAWVAERKDLLGGLFFLLTLAAYAHYARRPFSALRYLPVLLLFALGLMAKPMLVTLPFVLLLLDYWPLRRTGEREDRGTGEQENRGAGEQAKEPFSIASGATGSASADGRQCRCLPLTRLLLEKLPLLLLAAASCTVTLLAQQSAMAPQRLTLPWRIGNALVSYATYLVQFFYPVALAVFYPHPRNGLPIWQIAAAALLLVVVSAAVFVVGRKSPCLLVGWLWYLGTLVPVIGLVQVGSQANADRYTYLPQIGLAIMLAWGLRAGCHWLNTSPLSPRGRGVGGEGAYSGDPLITTNLSETALTPTLSQRERETLLGQRLCAAASALVLAVFMGLAWRQVGFWSNSETLWTHALACTTQNGHAHNNLALYLAGLGRIDEAMDHYLAAMAINSDDPKAHNNYGLALVDRGRIDEALDQYHEALRIQPDDAYAQNNLGVALARCGRVDEAIFQYHQAIRNNPDLAWPHYNLGNALARRGRKDEAIDQYRQAIRIDPRHAPAQNNLALQLAAQGRLDEAIDHYRAALKSDPKHVSARNNLGIALARQGRVDEAIDQFQETLRIDPRHASVHHNLGLELAGRGQLDEAIAHFQQALQLKPDFVEARLSLADALRKKGK